MAKTLKTPSTTDPVLSFLTRHADTLGPSVMQALKELREDELDIEIEASPIDVLLEDILTPEYKITPAEAWAIVNASLADAKRVGKFVSANVTNKDVFDLGTADQFEVGAKLLVAFGCLVTWFETNPVSAGSELKDIVPNLEAVQTKLKFFKNNVTEDTPTEDDCRFYVESGFLTVCTAVDLAYQPMWNGKSLVVTFFETASCATILQWLDSIRGTEAVQFFTRKVQPANVFEVFNTPKAIASVYKNVKFIRSVWSRKSAVTSKTYDVLDAADFLWFFTATLNVSREDITLFGPQTDFCLGEHAKDLKSVAFSKYSKEQYGFLDSAECHKRARV